MRTTKAEREELRCIVSGKDPINGATKVAVCRDRIWSIKLEAVLIAPRIKGRMEYRNSIKIHKSGGAEKRLAHQQTEVVKYTAKKGTSDKHRRSKYTKARNTLRGHALKYRVEMDKVR